LLVHWVGACCLWCAARTQNGALVHWCIGALAQQSSGEFSVHFWCISVHFGAFPCILVHFRCFLVHFPRVAQHLRAECTVHRADSCSAHLSLHRVCAIDSLSAANVAAIWACMRDCAAPSHWEILSKRQGNDDLLLLSVSRGPERGQESPRGYPVGQPGREDRRRPARVSGSSGAKYANARPHGNGRETVVGQKAELRGRREDRRGQTGAALIRTPREREKESRKSCTGGVRLKEAGQQSLSLGLELWSRSFGLELELRARLEGNKVYDYSLAWQIKISHEARHMRARVTRLAGVRHSQSAAL